MSRGPSEGSREAPVAEPPTSTVRGTTATGTPTTTLRRTTAQGSSAAAGRGGYVPTFAVGDVVAGRYRVVTFIARGGMGEVYEVDDLDLKGRIALKTVRAEMAVNAAVVERFLREVQLARKVSHPNVCRIFDLGRHQLPPTEPAGAPTDILFLTMELLAGETLSQRLKRLGPFEPEEALPLVRHMGWALATAHEADIVHRDFKSANVMLVAGKGGERAVVTDFGIARAAEGQGGGTVTATGEMIGTPAYMAPEQVEGATLTSAVDIYALGVVLFEMVTGTLPFTGDSPVSTAVRRLREKPPSPRQFNAKLDPVWEAVILRCLERRPEDRFGRADEVARALEAGQAGRARRTRPWLWPALAAAAVLLALGGWLGFSRWRTRSAAPVTAVAPAAAAAQGASPAAEQAGAPAAAQGRPAVAVIGFRNLGQPDAAWLSTAISEMLRTELAAGGRMRTVPGESVARMKLELKLADADSLAADTLARIRSLSGADFVVLGSYLSLGPGRLRIDMRLQDAGRGELVASSADEGTVENLFELVSRSGGRLREALSLGDVSAGDALAARASFPATREAARLYAEGLARLRVFDAREARALFEKAAEREPRHPLVHAALAQAWSALGYDARARGEASRAAELADELPRAERLEIQALHAELSGDWGKACETYRALIVFFPDRLEYGLRLAAAQVSAGRPQEAAPALAELRRLPEPARSDPRIDLAEASAAKALTDFERQRELSERAAAAAQRQGAVLLFAQARSSEAQALVNLDRIDEARRASAQAAELFAASGDLGNAARARNVIAVSHAMRGEFAQARAGFEAALAEFRSIGDQRGTATQLENVANAALRLGQPQEARALLSQALAVARETGEVSLSARILSNLANSLEEGGDLAAALRRNEEALAAWREIGATANEAVTLANLGEVCFKSKQLALARKRFEESLAVSGKAGLHNEDTAWAQGRLAAVLVAQGQLAAAEAALVDAVAAYRALGVAAEQQQLLRTLADLRQRRGNAAGAQRARVEADRLRSGGEKP